MSVYTKLTSDLAYLAAKIGPEAAVLELAHSKMATKHGAVFHAAVADLQMNLRGVRETTGVMAATYAYSTKVAARNRK